MEAVIGFFRGAFTIVLALALGEAFKQFVTDRLGNTSVDQEPAPDYPVILWKRLPALLSFLFLIWPFFQGMNSYFYATYRPGALPQPYSLYLSTDGILFTIEAALFFVMSRALPLAKWKLFYLCIFWLLVVDSVWALIALTHMTEVKPWMILNIASLPVLGGTLWILHCITKGKDTVPTAAWYVIAYGLPALTAFRTIMDYTLTWSFYFPDS